MVSEQENQEREIEGRGGREGEREDQGRQGMNVRLFITKGSSYANQQSQQQEQQQHGID